MQVRQDNLRFGNVNMRVEQVSEVYCYYSNSIECCNVVNTPNVPVANVDCAGVLTGM